jgi:hypothetical protein
VSYSFFVLTASKVSQRLALEATEAQQYFGIYFVISQLLLLAVVFLLIRVDWRYLFAARRFRWLRQEDLGRP